MSGSLSVQQFSLFFDSYFVTQGDFLTDPYKVESLAIPGRLPESCDSMFAEESVNQIAPPLNSLVQKRVVSLSETIARAALWNKTVEYPEKKALTTRNLIQLAYAIDTALLHGKQCFPFGYISSKHIAAPFKLFIHYKSGSVIVIPKKSSTVLTEGKDIVGRRAFLLNQRANLEEKSLATWEISELFHQKSKIDPLKSKRVLDRRYQVGKKLPLASWYCTFTKKGNMHQLFDFYEGELLSDSIKNKKCDYSTLVSYAREIAISINKLHINGIVHNNLRPDNILINKEGSQQKVVFFGTRASALVKESRATEGLDPSFTHPATLKMINKKLEAKSIPKDLFKRDIYALGCVLWMMHWKKELPWTLKLRGDTSELLDVVAVKMNFRFKAARALKQLYSKNGLPKDDMLIASAANALLHPIYKRTIYKLGKLIQALEEVHPPIIRIQRS